jgi:hypothetical protein
MQTFLFTATERKNASIISVWESPGGLRANHIRPSGAKHTTAVNSLKKMPVSSGRLLDLQTR